MEDAELLAEYARTGSEAAFRTLVERHLNLVHGSALRQLNEPHLAEEVTQAVFILLARKARSLGRKTVLVGWLFRTTRFVASHARRTEHRRRRREQEAFEMQNIASTRGEWERIAPVLDEALEKLGQHERNAVLLRFVEGRNHREVGLTLGLSEEAARKRVDRALEKLRGFFAGRGFTLSAAALGTVLLAGTAKAAPAALVNAIATGAIAGGKAAASTLPPIVAHTIEAWRWAKLKLAGGIIASGAMLVALITMSLPHTVSDRTATSSFAATAGTSTLPDQGARDSEGGGIRSTSLGTNVSVEHGFLLKVVAADTGEAIGRAPLVAMLVTKGKWEPNYNLATDDSGLCRVPVGPDLSRLVLGVLAEGWGARYVAWRPAMGDDLPSEYTLRLERVTDSIGGRLQDEAGQPIAGGEIWVEFGGIGDYSDREAPRERTGVYPEGRVAVTGRDGRWHCTVISTNATFSLEARHPDFAPTKITKSQSLSQPAVQSADPGKEDIRQLQLGLLTTKMKRGLTLYGRITDSSNQPIAGAVISHNPMFITGKNILSTDLDGRFTFNGLPQGRFVFVASADGFAPEHRELELKDGLDPVSIALRPGGKLRVRVVDKTGTPVPAAEVELQQWGTNLYDLVWCEKTGADGRVEWSSAPPGTDIELSLMKEGWCYKRGIHVTADGEEHTFVLQRGLGVSGEVIDAATGAPIPEFKAIPGSGADTWERSATRHGANGRFKMVFDEAGRWQVRIEANGYLPEVSGPLVESSTNTLHFALRRSDAVAPMHGTVFQPDGSPAAGVQVALLTLDNGVALVDSEFTNVSAGGLTKTDATGSFSFKPDRRAHSIASVSPLGYAKLRVRDAGQPIAVRLQPWGRVEATLSADFQVETINSIGLADETAMEYRGSVGIRKALWPNSTGRYVFEKVPAGTYHLSVYRAYTNMPKTLFPSMTEISVRPGETTEVRLEVKGRTIVGRLIDKSGTVQFGTGVSRARLTSRSRTPPTAAQRATVRSPASNADAAAFMQVDFWQSPAALERYRSRDTYFVVISPNGELHAEGVQPGAYRLEITIAGRSLTRDVQIPEITSGGPEKLDLGTLELPDPVR